MKFSIEWLKKFIDFNSANKQVADQITSAGLEVESIEGDVFTIKVPPNRADCLGMVGLARDIAAVSMHKFIEPKVQQNTATIDDRLSIEVLASKECPKYLCRVIKGIDNTRITPQWIHDCLTTANMKLISPVVDITNYVLLEWGQPTHAFDLQKITGNIVVRKAKNKETLTLLDDSTVELNGDTLIIADKNTPLAVAGIKGGKESGIEPTTTDIVLEVAYFEPVGIRLSSRHYGIKTDSAYRYERCIDPAMQERVMEHLTSLILEVVGGQAGPVQSFVEQKHLPKTIVLSLRIARIKKILGVELDMQSTINILQYLGFQVETHNSHDELMVTVPSFRQDITREIDLIEEVGRVYGLDKIPAQPMQGSLEFMPVPEAKITEEAIFSCMVNRGYHEVITYSFIDAEYAKNFNINFNDDLVLQNPISSEMGYMRSSLIPGLLKVIEYNQNRQQDRIRIFEVGLRFMGSMRNLEQVKTIAGACYGNDLPQSWGNPKRLVDIYDVKGDVMALLKLSRNLDEISFKQATDMTFHPGQALDIYLKDILIGKVGAVHPRLQQMLGLTNPVVVFELNYDLLTNGKVVKFAAFGKFPSVRRDIAILVAKDISAGNIEHAIRQEAGPLLTELVLFDIYEGKGIDPTQKSMALSLTLQHMERTLTDTEVNEVFDNVVNMLKREFNASQR